jgi:hypothetical protein
MADDFELQKEVKDDGTEIVTVVPKKKKATKEEATK